MHSASSQRVPTRSITISFAVFKAISRGDLSTILRRTFGLGSSNSLESQTRPLSISAVSVSVLERVSELRSRPAFSLPIGT